MPNEDLIEKIKQYQKEDREDTLYDLPDLDAIRDRAKEIADTYEKAIQQGYAPTEQDKDIRKDAIIWSDPDMIDTLKRRMQSDKIEKSLLDEFDVGGEG